MNTVDDTVDVVFAGPTLSCEQVEEHLPGSVCLPPVSQGDVYRASLERPRAIGIIDGYFELVPAVWHKEILWAMHRGIHVFGAASMGALRAAELNRYGMVGVGAIFEAIAQGALRDDDEVAVAHGPADTDYKKLSEAMINIRATCARAAAQGVLTRATLTLLLQAAKALFYGQRSYSAAIAGAAEAGADAAELERFRQWLPTGQVDQKADDAVMMLERMRALRDGPAQPLKVRFHFEHTDMWEQVGKRAGREGESTGRLNAHLEPLLDELRLLGADAFIAVADAAYRRAVGLELSQRQGHRPDADSIVAAALRFRRQQGLHSAQAVQSWLDAQDLNADALQALMTEDSRLAMVSELYGSTITAHLPNVLRLRGDYGALRSRALDKQRTLADSGLKRPSLSECELDEAGLLAWYFTAVLDRPAPADVGAYMAELACPSRAAFTQLLLREWWYRQLSVPDSAPDAPC